MPDPLRDERDAGLGNPLKSEASAFRWLLVVAAVALAVILVTLLARALA